MKVPSYLNIGMCLMDVCFNYLFIYVLDMGVVGAALGTGLAELITAMAMLYFLTVRSPELNLRQDKGSFKPTGKVIAKAAGIGGPMALQNVLIRGGYIASTIIVAPRPWWASPSAPAARSSPSASPGSPPAWAWASWAFWPS